MGVTYTSLEISHIATLTTKMNAQRDHLLEGQARAEQSGTKPATLSSVAKAR